MFRDYIKFSELYDKLLKEGLIAKSLAFRIHHDGMRIGQFLNAGRVKFRLTAGARDPVADHGTQAGRNIPNKRSKFSGHEESVTRLGRRMVRSGIRKRLVSANELRVAFISTGAEKDAAITLDLLGFASHFYFSTSDPAVLQQEPCRRRLRQNGHAFF